MKPLRLVFLVVCLICAGVATIFAQAANDYRSAQSGNWNATSTWQKYTGSAWAAATLIPDSSVGMIEILAGHTITVTTNIVVDSVFVDSLATLVVNANDTVTVGPPNLGASAGSTGISVLGGGSMLVNGVYRHARDGGSYPRATWNVGATCLISPGSITLATVPGNRNQSFYNFEWNCPNQTANLNLSLTGATDSIRGNFVLRASGTGRLYLTAPGTTTQIYAAPINIMGDLIMYNGQFGVNGSSSLLQNGLTYYQVNVGGNLTVNGSGSTTSYFAITRGSAAQTIISVKGNVTFSACSLSTSNNADSKIVFAKGSGIQNLSLGGVTISSSAAFSYEVAAGSTVNIDTSKITGNGTFVITNDGALKVKYGTNSGSISCTGTSNTVAYNNYAIAKDITGPGSATFTAGTPASTYLSDPTKSIPRYYTISSDTGITAGTVVFNYSVTETASLTEANLVPAQYSGSGTVWYVRGPATNTTTHVATSYAGVNPNGVWTVADASILTVTGVSTPSTSGIPEKFFVDQNYPNPFNPATNIQFGLPKEDFVTVKVYNIMGQEVATLFAGNKSAGVHTLHFDASSFSSGVYLYRIQAGRFVEVKRMLFMK
ncbi:MAG: T9SS type A sorting domain-containing protein [Bacteroidota bacterium]|jgi:hypothetical protein